MEWNGDYSPHNTCCDSTTFRRQFNNYKMFKIVTLYTFGDPLMKNTFEFVGPDILTNNIYPQ